MTCRVARLSFLIHDRRAGRGFGLRREQQSRRHGRDTDLTVQLGLELAGVLDRLRGSFAGWGLQGRRLPSGNRTEFVSVAVNGLSTLSRVF